MRLRNSRTSARAELFFAPGEDSMPSALTYAPTVTPARRDAHRATRSRSDNYATVTTACAAMRRNSGKHEPQELPHLSCA